MLAVGWIDNKAVHFVSTADTTETVIVSRRAGNKKKLKSLLKWQSKIITSSWVASITMIV